jgi:hypothetical protein
MFFTQAIWQAHAKEEMMQLAKVMEQRFAQNNNHKKVPNPRKRCASSYSFF